MTSGPTLSQELLEGAVFLEAVAAADPTRPGLVDLELPAANRLARLLRTAADVVDVAVTNAGPGPGQCEFPLGHIDDSGI